MKTTTSTARKLSPIEQQRENRRHTRNLSDKDLDYLLRRTKLLIEDKDLRNQLVTDAILYYAKPGNEVPQGEKGITYYLSIKAQCQYRDYLRTQSTTSRGSGKVTAVSHLNHFINKDGEQTSILEPYLGVSNNMAAQDLDAEKLRATIFHVLGKYPEKLRILELRMEGFKTADIAVMLGYEKDNRIRKSLHDTLHLLLRTIPGLAQQVKELAPDNETWAERRQARGQSAEESGFMSTKECLRRQYELEMELA